MDKVLAFVAFVLQLNKVTSSSQIHPEVNQRPQRLLKARKFSTCLRIYVFSQNGQTLKVEKFEDTCKVKMLSICNDTDVKMAFQLVLTGPLGNYETNPSFSRSFYLQSQECISVQNTVGIIFYYL